MIATRPYSSLWQPGDTILVPRDNEFFIVGGTRADNLSNITFDVEGSLNAVFDPDNWPMGNNTEVGGTNIVYLELLAFEFATDFTIRGLGRNTLINGNGKNWWNRCIAGLITWCANLMSLFFPSLNVSLPNLDSVYSSLVVALAL